MKWQQDKTYVYYIPEADMIYSARYLPSETVNIHGEPWTSEKDFGDATKYLQNFNPDVLIIMTKDYQYKKLDVVYLGEL